MKNENTFVLERVIEYATEIEKAIKQYELDYQKFCDDSFARSKIIFLIAQIGELVNNLTEEYKQKYMDVPWLRTASMKNMVAHAYFEMRAANLWDAVILDVPNIKMRCKKMLGEYREEHQEEYMDD